MRKAGLWVVAVCILMLLFAGCGVSEPPPEQDPAPDVRDGEWAELPETVLAIMETLRPIHAGTTVVEGDKTYFIVSDADPAAGYGVEIADINIEGDQAVVTVAIIEPDPGADPADMVSHPYDVETRDGVFTDVYFQHVDGEYFPRVVGLDGPFQLVERSENILAGPAEMKGSRIQTAGLARVFEATVSYELLDANGKVLLDGFTTAASGGPDWGFFEVGFDYPATNAASLVLFQASAKDGSKMDTVEVPVERCG